VSVSRRRAKAARNAATVAKMPAVVALVRAGNDEWVTSGRMACSYGAHLREDLPDDPLGPAWTCPRCGAVYLKEDRG
jgi:hypothetical protein